MGDYVKNAFARMNLWQIRAFVLYGTEQNNPPDEPYDVRLKTATAPIYNRINGIYTTPSELTEASNDISIALSACEEVYMEIGMKLGARLIYQLLLMDDKPDK